MTNRISAGLLALMVVPAGAEEAPPPLSQEALNAMVQADAAAAFAFAFEAGDELTEFSFDGPRGVGAQIGEGRVFTRIPRADLDGPGEWATHFPKREGGANATSCIACHNAPLPNGAGDVALNVLVDPGHTGNPALYLERNTLPLFALGIPQRLAEELSLELYLARAEIETAACSAGMADGALSAKGVSFGMLRAVRVSSAPCMVSFDTAGLQGVDPDLVVRAFGWKGTAATIREFTRGAAHNELGLQGVELVGDQDGDYDGVIDELTVGDMTALTVYMAALERPSNVVELASLGLMEISAEAVETYARGEAAFGAAQCVSCHIPQMALVDTQFSEPTRTPGFFDVTFPDGSDPLTRGLNATIPVAFDLAGGQPNNAVALGEGTLGGLARDGDGMAQAAWFTDFKRHDMGAALADPDDPLGIGAAMWLTRSLAGVGSTGPWLHDGRATTLTGAIALHGGAASASRDLFAGLPEGDQAALIAFLEGQVIFHTEAGEGDH